METFSMPHLDEYASMNLNTGIQRTADYCLCYHWIIFNLFNSSLPSNTSSRSLFYISLLKSSQIVKGQYKDYLVGQPTTPRGGRILLLLPCHQFHISHRNTIVPVINDSSLFSGSSFLELVSSFSCHRVITRSISVIGAIGGVKPGAMAKSSSKIKEIAVKPLGPEFQTQPKMIEIDILVQPFKIAGATFEALLFPQCGIHMSLMKM